MIAQNRFTKYLLYALGEIVLVVIGILLALKLDAMSDERKGLKEEQEILASLDLEFGINLELLAKMSSNNDRVGSSTDRLLRLVGQNEEELGHHNIDSLLYLAIGIEDFSPNEFILEQIKSNGKIQLIQSETLKQLLYQWESTIHKKSEAFEMLNTYFMNSLIPYLDNHASIRNIDLYGDHDWAGASVLDDRTEEMFGSFVCENHLENHMWCVRRFGSAMQELQVIAADIRKEIAGNLQD